VVGLVRHPGITLNHPQIKKKAADIMLCGLEFYPTMKGVKAYMKKRKKFVILICMALVMLSVFCITASAAGSGDVAGAVQSTWSTASQQIKTVVNKVVFPAIDLILAVFFFAKLGTAYFDYRKQGQFEWAAPAILFACLVFTLTAPLYIWGVIGM
jgi:hypothetical protein